jgi:hypothetical protein
MCELRRRESRGHNGLTAVMPAAGKHRLRHALVRIEKRPSGLGSRANDFRHRPFCGICRVIPLIHRHRPVPDKWATIGHWLDRPHSPSDHPGLAFALVGWAIVVLTSCLERRRQERHTERETNSPFSCRSASACEKPPNDEVRVMFTVGWLVVLFGVLAMRWADGSFHSQ